MYGITHRPEDFESVIGLDPVKRVVRATLQSGDLDNAYVFSGPWGTGKTTMARIFARAVLCQNKQEDQSPCNKCSSCKSFLKDSNPSYMEIDAVGKGNKEDIDHLLGSLSYENMAGRRIILIDESHRLSSAGNDALLKVLEDPNLSQDVIFIFCTTEVEKMTEALVSRCTRFSIISPNSAQIKSKLKLICEREGLEYDDTALGIIADYGNGHYRDAENALRSVSRLGKIDVESVGDVLSIYTVDVARLLLELRMSLKDALATADELCSKSSVNSIYSTILKLLVDTKKLSLTGKDPEGNYEKLLKDISSTYGNALVPILDYILGKDKMSDKTVFQSDLILVHYKFLRGDFDTTVEQKIQSNKTSAKKVAKAESDPAKDIKNLDSWERIEAAKRIKASSRGKQSGKKVDERISKEWGGPNKSGSSEPVSISRDIDPSRYSDVRAKGAKKI
jgi:DNA polymerase III subunit gamma/tau